MRYLIPLLLLFILLGPRPKKDTTVYPVTLPDDLDDYLAAREATVPGITPGAEKAIVWAGQPGAKTPLSIVYLHGFSATRQETAPLSETIAAELGANLFATRLTGHGLDGEALGRATVRDWCQDAMEALAIGRRLGDKVIIVAVSTGATIATWLAAQPEAQAHLAALIFVSPNFGIKDPASEIFGLPWGKQIARLIVGPELKSEPGSDAAARYWTHRYPIDALLPVLGMLQVVRRLPLKAVTTPTLVIYSPQDQVVNPQRTLRTFEQLGAAPKRLIPLYDAGGVNHHVIAGDIVSPDTTAAVRDHALSFIRSLTTETV